MTTFSRLADTPCWRRGSSLVCVKALRWNCPFAVCFETPTIRDLAGHVEAALRNRTGEQAPPIVRVSHEANLPLSFVQQRLWFLHELEPTSSFYNVPVAVRLRSRLQIDAMQRTLNEIVRRHESLRTSFPTIDAQPVQSIAPTLALDLSLIDLSTLREEEREHEVQRRATEEARAPFNLATGPLCPCEASCVSARKTMCCS